MISFNRCTLVLIFFSSLIVSEATAAPSGRSGRSRPYERPRPTDRTTFDSERPTESGQPEPPKDNRYVPVDPFLERQHATGDNEAEYNEQTKLFEHESIRRHKSTATTSNARDLFAETVTTIQLIAILPRGQEYGNVFVGNEFTANAESEINRAEEKFAELANRTSGQFVNFQTGGANELLADLKAVPGAMSIIVGHSEGKDGEQILRLPDGTSISVDALTTSATLAGTPCIIVTCHSRQLGIESEISLGAAYNLCVRAIERCQSKGAVTGNDILVAMRSEAATWLDPGLSIVVLLLAGAGTTSDCMLVIYNYDDDEQWGYYWMIGGGAVTAGSALWFVRRRRRHLAAI